ncbi:MAG: M1 family aminopeptidase [Planctomycetota bacterium]
MEYPTLITVFGDRFAPDYAVGMEGVTIHEFGHQYFYGLIGTNEFEEAWLDEGFTSFTDARVYDVAYGTQRTRLRYGPVHQPYHRPFEAPSVFGRLRGFSQLEGWLSHTSRTTARSRRRRSSGGCAASLSSRAGCRSSRGRGSGRSRCCPTRTRTRSGTTCATCRSSTSTGSCRSRRRSGIATTGSTGATTPW